MSNTYKPVKIIVQGASEEHTSVIALIIKAALTEKNIRVNSTLTKNVDTENTAGFEISIEQRELKPNIPISFTL